MSDRARWKDQPVPNYSDARAVADNTDMDGRLNAAISHLNAKVEWLKGHFGDFTQTPNATEPERDTTPAAPLPSYANPDTKQVTIYFEDHDSNPWSAPYAYAYDDTKTPVVEHLGIWPGRAMEPDVPNYSLANVPTAAEPVKWKLTFTPLTPLDENHRVIFSNNGAEETRNNPLSSWSVYTRSGTVTGVDNINAETELTESYYNLQGIRVESPRKGETYIRVRGSQSTKVRF